MSSHNTPSAPGSIENPAVAPDVPTREPGRDPETSYFQADAADHDLEANAPRLGRPDLKMGRNWIWIGLAAIVALVLLVFFVFVLGGGNDTVAENKPPRQENVTVPDAPETPPEAPSPPPIAVQPASVRLPPSPAETPEPAQRPPTLLERRIASAEALAATFQQPSNPYLQALSGMQGEKATGAQEKPTVRTAYARYLRNPDALLVRGTYLRCVLETRIVTDIKGFTSCIVTEPVYSINGHRLLIPKGSKISGSYNTDAIGPRVTVVWDRILTPDGVDVAMSSPGVDNLGGAGHPGDYNAHWPSRISAALMISLISDAFKYAAAEHGPPSTTVTNGIVTQEPFESNTARTMERLANQALDRSISRPATVTLNQGEVVNVYVAQDIDFSGVLAGL